MKRSRRSAATALASLLLLAGPFAARTDAAPNARERKQAARRITDVAPDTLELKSNMLRVRWRRAADGWHAEAVTLKGKSAWTTVGTPLGEYETLFSADKPSAQEVVANTAGMARRLLPATAARDGQAVRFQAENETTRLEARWEMDPHYANDLRVTLTLTARRHGYYALATPTLVTIAREQLRWGLIPGYWQGTALQPDFERAFQYGQGIPDRPVLARERTATTLCPLLTTTQGATIGVIPEPGTGRDPWTKDRITHNEWRLGLSLMDRAGRLAPTAYAPVLGEAGSLLEPGQSVTLRYRYTIQSGDWTGVYRHAVEDVYRFSDFLALKQTRRSLSQRLRRLQTYVTDDKSSLWQTDQVDGKTIGAQSYLGGVRGARRGEASKNSDIGAMWMLARITGDPVLYETRLPYVRNFKLAQQQTEPGFFQGAAIGQYWLRDSHRFVEEWGPYIEPMALTYYSLIDDGNILLFAPDDRELRERMRLGAETLLRWQKPDGSWEVAYDRQTHALAYPRLTDLRPTWYGLLAAYRLLGDRRYLEAAVRGADWFVQHAVAKGHYLGVCGDADFVMDFATGQSAQCLLDLYERTGTARYREAALRTARLYWTWTYTHPMPTTVPKTVPDSRGQPVVRQDWEIAQAGLNMEHGGTHGSANSMGPILLCSHAGMFVRFYEQTGDRLFLEMARAAALGRDAFVDEATGVASYYWRAMNAGAGPFPHHAWWQIGWIMDYLLAEAQMRSKGQIRFPRGFVTPKVGPQQCAGFAPGAVYGTPATLWMPPKLLAADSPYADLLSALSTDGKTLFVLVLGENHRALTTTVTLDPRYARPGSPARIQSAKTLAGKVTNRSLEAGRWTVQLPPYGLTVLAVSLQ